MIFAVQIGDEFLEFDDTPSMSLYIRNSLFSFEVVDGNKSLPFDFPGNGHNRRLTGFYDRIDSDAPDTVTATLWLAGNPYRQGKLKFTFSDGSFSGTFFWGLASKATELKDLKLSAIDHEVNMAASIYSFSYLNAPDVFPHLPNEIGVVYTLRVQVEGEEIIEVEHTATTADRLDAFSTLATTYNSDYEDQHGGVLIATGTNGETDPLLRVVWMKFSCPVAETMVVLEVVAVAPDGTTTKQRFSNEDVAAYADTTFYSSEVYFPILYVNNFDKESGYPMHTDSFTEEFAVDKAKAKAANIVISGAYDQEVMMPTFNAAWLVSLIAEQLGVVLSNQVPSDWFIFPAQCLNFQHRFVVGDMLPDISVADFLKRLGKVFCLSFTYDDELNVLYVDRKKELVIKDVQGDFTEKAYHYQGYHGKESEEEEGYTLGFSDGIIPNKVEGNGGLDLLSQDTTLTMATGSDVSFLGLGAPQAPIYRENGFQYKVEGASGRIDKLIFIQSVLDPSQPKARSLEWESLYNAYWKEYLEMVLRPKLTLPLNMRTPDVFSIRERVPIELAHIKMWVEEWRLELEEEKVTGEMIAKRIV